MDRIHRAGRAALTALAIATAPAAAAFQPVPETPALASPLASRVLLNGVARAGARVVAVGQRGHVLFSDDEGRSWSQARVPVSSDLVAVAFPSEQQGWAVGHDGAILHSSDRGATWESQPSSPPSGPAGDRSFLDVWFDDEHTGFVVGAFGAFLRTSDGGRSWSPWSDRAENPRMLHLYAIRRIGRDLFAAGEQGLVLKLDPRAQRFRAVRTPYDGTFFGLTGKPGVVVVFGLRGHAFRTTDAGASWQRIPSGVGAALTGATVADDGRIVLVSQDGHVLVSTDDGATFAPLRISRPFPSSAVVSGGPRGLVLAGVLGVQVQSLE